MSSVHHYQQFVSQCSCQQMESYLFRTRFSKHTAWWLYKSEKEGQSSSNSRKRRSGRTALWASLTPSTTTCCACCFPTELLDKLDEPKKSSVVPVEKYHNLAAEKKERKGHFSLSHQARRRAKRGLSREEEEGEIRERALNQTTGDGSGHNGTARGKKGLSGGHLSSQIKSELELLNLLSSIKDYRPKGVGLEVNLR